MTFIHLTQNETQSREIKTLNAVVSSYAGRIKFRSFALNKERRAILFDCVPL